MIPLQCAPVQHVDREAAEDPITQTHLNSYPTERMASEL